MLLICKDNQKNIAQCVKPSEKFAKISYFCKELPYTDFFNYKILFDGEALET